MSTTACGSTPFFSAIESASVRERTAEPIRKFPTSLTITAALASSPKSKMPCPPLPSEVVGLVLWLPPDQPRESRAVWQLLPRAFQRWVPQYRHCHVVHAVPQASLIFQATPCSSKHEYHLLPASLKNQRS